MKTFGITLVFLSVFLTSCSQFVNAVPTKDPTPEVAPPPPPPPPPVTPPAATEPKINPEDFISKNDFARFQQQLLTKPAVEKLFRSQQDQMTEIGRDLASLKEVAVPKPEWEKSRELMLPRSQFEKYVAEQNQAILSLQRENQALRAFAKETEDNAKQITEMRSNELWHKTIIALVICVAVILTLLGAGFLALSHRIRELRK